MAQQAIYLTGSLQVGTGKVHPLMTACGFHKPDGGAEILVSADGRHVWLNLDRASALALAAKLQEICKD